MRPWVRLLIPKGKGLNSYLKEKVKASPVGFSVSGDAHEKGRKTGDSYETTGPTNFGDQRSVISSQQRGRGYNPRQRRVRLRQLTMETRRIQLSERGRE